MRASLSIAVVLAALLAATARAAAPQPLLYSELGGVVRLGTVAGSTGRLLDDGSGERLTLLALSADGRRALVEEDVDGEDLLAILSTRGGEPKPVRGGTEAETGSFAPDGRSILLARDDGIYTLAVSGGMPKLLLRTPEHASPSLPVISPDGETLAFVGGAHSEDLLVVRLPKGKPHRIATGLAATPFEGARLFFSPDGRTLVYAGTRSRPGIFAVLAAGGRAKQLTRGADTSPNVTADGRSVVFVRDAHAGQGALWTVRLDGSHARRVRAGEYQTVVLAAYPKP